MRRHVLVLFLAATALPALADGWVAPMPAAAERYVDEALRRNLELQARSLDVDDARSRLQEARSALQPRLDLAARYTRAEGGRTFDIPTGDLLNPVYQALDEQRVSQGLPPAFPRVENQSIPLLREREQETKLRLTQPLYRPQLTRGIAAARLMTESRTAELAAHRRELRATVLTAYHRYLQAESALAILDATAAVTVEALRVNRALAEADKVTADRVLRAEADDLEVQQHRAEAQRDRDLARAQFNHLLDRPLDTPIDLPADTELQQAAQALIASAAPSSGTTDQREERLALQRALDAARAAEDAARAGQKPTLTLVADGGVQGSKYRTGRGHDFVQASLVAEFNLWDGRQRRAQVDQAVVARRRIELQLARVGSQLRLQVQESAESFRAAVLAYRAAARRTEAATRAFELVAQREREGMTAQLSFLDARAERTRAELNHAITRARLFIAAANLERATALTPLP